VPFPLSGLAVLALGRLHEFDFRYSNRSAMGIEDAERTTRAIKGASGKRLTDRLTGRQSAV
jgi:hypothetical protein